MNDLERETERSPAEIGMGDGEIARRQPWRQRQPPWSDLKRVIDAAKHQRLALDEYSKRHADAVADIFLETGRSGEAFRGVDDLRKSAGTRADAGPDLAAARGILRHRHDHRHAGFGSGRQRPTDQACKLRQPPADPAEAGLVDFADIDDGFAV